MHDKLLLYAEDVQQYQEQLILLQRKINCQTTKHHNSYIIVLLACMLTLVSWSRTPATYASVFRLTPSLRFTCRGPSSPTNSPAMCRSFLWKSWRLVSRRSAHTCRKKSRKNKRGGRERTPKDACTSGKTRARQSRLFVGRQQG